MKHLRKRRYAPPRAAALLHTLRGLGYSTQAALADIVDNSYSALASNVWIDFHWDSSNSYLTIRDDGSGMKDADLELALTLGGRSPLDSRTDNDLGRFSMGLKSASFSQAKKLTVISRTAESPDFAILGWDLDKLENDPEADWYLEEGLSAESANKVSSQMDELEHGTIVLWEDLDRIVTPKFDVTHLGNLLDQIRQGLGMIFQRIILDSSRDFKIWVNSKAVEPWDPFLSSHPSKPWTSPEARMSTSSGNVTVQCHVLPHKDRLTTSEFEKASGPNGWAAQQGFYLYRNKRLILAGSWLGLGGVRAWAKEESMRLARIRVDISNHADGEWDIDIKKSTAKAPIALRSWLTQLAQDTRDKARATFAYRSIPTRTRSSETADPVWYTTHTEKNVAYKIDHKHAVVAAVLESCADKKALITAMLRSIEETVPVQRIWLDAADNDEIPQLGFSNAPLSAPEGLIEVLDAVLEDLLTRQGLSHEAAQKRLLTTEPFQKFPELVEDLVEKNKKKDKSC